jgi:hypothetical protein
MKMIEIAKQAGGVFGKDVMLAMLRPKLQPHLARFKLTWDDVLPVLSDIHSLKDLHHALKTAPVFVLKLVVASKLRDLNVKDKHVKRITNIIDAIGSDQEHMRHLAQAVVPLTQGILDTSKVEAFILAVLKVEKGAEYTSDEKLKTQAMAVIGEAVQPLVQAKLSVLGVPEATQARLAALVLQAASEPEQAKAVFAAVLPLVQGKPTVAAVEALLVAVLRLDSENGRAGGDTLKAQAMAVIGEAVEPLVHAKLSLLGVPEATQTRLAALVLQAASEPEQAKAVFAAALPLVQGKPTVAAVEALLVAVLRLDPNNRDLGESELKMQVMAVFAEAANPLVQANSLLRLARSNSGANCWS